MKRVKCKSGLMGSQLKLQHSYLNFEDFKSYCGLYSIHERLGYATAEAAWEDNPTIQVSVNPADFCKVK